MVGKPEAIHLAELSSFRQLTADWVYTDQCRAFSVKVAWSGLHGIWRDLRFWIFCSWSSVGLASRGPFFPG